MVMANQSENEELENVSWGKLSHSCSEFSYKSTLPQEMQEKKM